MNRIQKTINYYNWGGRFLTDPYHLRVQKLNEQEGLKSPKRFDIINYVLDSLKRPTTYLEIGVRNPNDNFNKILATTKYSVDPGIEFAENPVDFKVTSDAFFDGVRNGTFLDASVRFDVIFIDGLHLAEQVDRDIANALEFLKDDGFVVLHDCNPPTEWHAREEHNYTISPAGQQWNGPTWKGFLKLRYAENVSSCCIDTDWGVGIISKNKNLGSKPSVQNPFYEFKVLDNNRKDQLNLLTFEEFKDKI